MQRKKGKHLALLFSNFQQHPLSSYNTFVKQKESSFSNLHWHPLFPLKRKDVWVSILWSLSQRHRVVLEVELLMVLKGVNARQKSLCVVKHQSFFCWRLLKRYRGLSDIHWIWEAPLIYYSFLWLESLLPKKDFPLMFSTKHSTLYILLHSHT